MPQSDQNHDWQQAHRSVPGRRVVGTGTPDGAGLLMAALYVLLLAPGWSFASIRRSLRQVHSRPIPPRWPGASNCGTTASRFEPSPRQPSLDAAAAARPSDYLGLVCLDWELARDDAAFEPMTSAESSQPDWKYSEVSPRHLHAETVIGGARVHVDWVHARKQARARSIDHGGSDLRRRAARGPRWALRLLAGLRERRPAGGGPAERRHSADRGRRDSRRTPPQSHAGTRR